MTPVQRSEEETEVDVKQNGEADRAEREFLNLIFGKLNRFHRLVAAGVGETAAFPVATLAGLKVTLRT